MTQDFDIYRWKAEQERAIGYPPVSLWQLMYPESQQEPKLDPANNRIIVFSRNPSPSEMRRLLRKFTPQRPDADAAAGCIVALGIIVGAFLLGRCT